MRIYLILLPTVVIIFSLVATRATAGLYADELSKCLVSSTTVEDRNYFVMWMFAAIAQHPEVKSMSTITAEQGEQLIEGTARLFERLLTESCRSQAKAAIDFEGASTLSASFKVLGEVAARGLFTNPDVANFSNRLDTYIDPEKLKKAIAAE